MLNVDRVSSSEIANVVGIVIIISDKDENHKVENIFLLFFNLLVFSLIYLFI